MNCDLSSNFLVFHIHSGNFQLVVELPSLSEGNCILMRPPGRKVSAALFEVKSNRLELKLMLAVILEFMNIKVVLRGMQF